MHKIKEYTWQPRALCLKFDPDVFFDDSGLPESSPTAANALKRQRAKAICRQCPVMSECRDTFIDEPYGVFGGLDQGERSNLRRSRTRRERRYREQQAHRDGGTEPGDSRQAEDFAEAA